MVTTLGGTAAEVLGDTAEPGPALEVYEESHRSKQKADAAPTPKRPDDEREERERLEREADRQKEPKAKRERLESRTAHQDAGDSEALSVAAENFEELIEEPLWRPLELPTEGDEAGPVLSENSRLIEHSDGETKSVVESTEPLVAEDESGDERPVDLALRREGEVFEPKNSPADVRLPTELGDGIELERADVSVRPGGSEDADEAKETAEKLFYANADRDTDFLVAPVPTGVQAFYFLRSPASPEELELDLDLPAGARVGPTDSPSEGAEVVRDGRRIAFISAPSVKDASGRAVPASLKVDRGDRVRFEVEHRSRDLLYPLLVDPVVRDQYSWRESPSQDFYGWQFYRQSAGVTFEGATSSAFGRGLSIKAPAGRTTSTWTRGSWVTGGAGDAYMYAAAMRAMAHTPASSHVEEALYKPGSGGYDGENFQHNVSYSNHEHVLCARATQTTCTVGGTPGNWLYYTLFLPSAISRSTTAEAYAGGIATYWHDDNAPTMVGPPLNDPQKDSSGQWVQTAPRPTGWTPRTDYGVRVRVRDNGLGVKRFRAESPDGTVLREDAHESSTCGAHCPGEIGSSIYYSVPEGVNPVQVRGLDNVDNATAVRPEDRWTHKVDRTKPVLSTSGTLKVKAVAGEWTNGGELDIQATDQDPSGPRAGVEKIDVSIDGQRADGKAQTCGQDSCPLSHRFTFPATGYADGEHQVRVTATDYAGHKTEESYTVRLDQTGPTLVLSGDLYEYRPGGSLTREALYNESYTLDAQARDEDVAGTRSGVARLELRIDGHAAVEHVTIQPCAAGSCPLSNRFTLQPDRYPPEGPHEVEVRGTDHAGNTTTQSWSIIIDRKGDIYEAEKHVSLPDDGEPRKRQERQWGRLGTHEARLEATHQRGTRQTRSSGDPKRDGPYDEVRIRTKLSEEVNPETGRRYEDEKEAFKIERGDVGDSNLPVIADMLAPASDIEEDEEPKERGALKTALEPWQVPPPAYGPTYELFEERTKYDPGKSGEEKDVLVRTWIDAKTKMPLREHMVDLEGREIHSLHFTYHHSRYERSELSSDFFGVEKPSNTELEKENDYNGDRDLGSVEDEETGSTFRPWFLGEYLRLGAANYLFTGSVTNRQRVSGGLAEGVLNPNDELSAEDGADPGSAGPTVSVGAYYARIPEPALGVTPEYRPGRIPADPPLWVESMAGSSQEAKAWRDTYREQALAIQANPTDPDFASAGVLTVTIGVTPTTAYVLRLDDGDTSAVLDTGETLLLIEGEYTKAQLQQLLERLEVR